MRVAPVARALGLERESWPELLGWLVLIVAGAAWATHTATVAGARHGPAAVALSSLLWAWGYVALGAAYGSTVEVGRSRRPVWRRAGLCLVLTLLSTWLCRYALTPRLTPLTWQEVFYLRRLVPLLLLPFWCSALMGRETVRLLRATGASVPLAGVPELVVLLVAAAVVISAGDLAFSFGEFTALDRWLREDVILPTAWATNTLILFCGLALVFAITRRVIAALLVVVPVYAAWQFATLEKIRYMHAALEPLDVIRLPAFLPFLRGFFGVAGIVALLAGVALWVATLVAAHRAPPAPVPPVRRWVIGGLAGAVLAAFPVAFAASASSPSAQWVLLRLGSPDRLWREKVRHNGLLLTFMFELPASVISTPPNYSASTVRRILEQYRSSGPPVAEGRRRGGVNLIVCLVESLMDPDDLGYRWSFDPISNLRALRESSGVRYAVVPEQFGGSANTEFEVLTGLTTAFLPHQSLPYRQYLKRPIPSLPQTLRGRGYATTAIQADPKSIYNREQVYGLLGFDRVVWLHETPGVTRSPRWWDMVSDEAVVASVIEASRRQRPFFVFAFTNSTHSPYDFGAYRRSPLRAVDAPDEATGDELQEYINAVRATDQSISRLIQYFRGRSDSTIVVILGDHLPPLSSGALENFSRRLASRSDGEQYVLTRRVPLVLWANFDLPQQHGDLSVNSLASYLLEQLQVPRQAQFAVGDSVRRALPVLGGYSRGLDDRLWRLDSLPPGPRLVADDYRLLQYDLLFGKQYAVGDRQIWSGASAGAGSDGHGRVSR